MCLWVTQSTLCSGHNLRVLGLNPLLGPLSAGRLLLPLHLPSVLMLTFAPSFKYINKSNLNIKKGIKYLERSFQLETPYIVTVLRLHTSRNHTTNTDNLSPNACPSTWFFLPTGQQPQCHLPKRPPPTSPHSGSACPLDSHLHSLYFTLLNGFLPIVIFRIDLFGVIYW